MMSAVLVAVLAFFYYQTALVVAYFAASIVATGTKTDLHWRLVYWLIVLVSLNGYMLIVH